MYTLIGLVACIWFVIGASLMWHTKLPILVGRVQRMVKPGRWFMRSLVEFLLFLAVLGPLGACAGLLISIVDWRRKAAWDKRHG